ncbi:CRISPR-associated endonuclease Cas2 [Schleiferilactobacillus harbinensis]|nr:CRISPR-associated endonuclease Cas2 [Schleiferilactobacillus harbinensis]MBO3090520.1 CRISPR-associated endonuclease Cas2 [Schleiferilactobacillus harbinensis]
MRVIVMFDLPVVEVADRKAANQFRHDLIAEGFVMMQYSVYYRIVNGLDMATKYEKRLEGYLPEKGQVRSLVLTEKQFAHMKVLVGDVSPQETNISGDSLTSL